MKSISRVLPNWLTQRLTSEPVLVGGTGLVLGLLSGLGVWVFKRLIDLAGLAAMGGLGGALGRISPWLLFLVPAAGGLVVGLLMHFFVGEERHHGVAGIMEAVALAGGRLRYQRAPVKVLAAALSIG